MARPAILAALTVLIAILAAGCTGTPSPGTQPVPNATLVVNGTTSVTLDYQEVLALPAVTGVGGAVSTTGIKYGPFRIRGVALSTLADLAGGMGADQTMRVHAPDGYMWVIDRERVDGHGFVVLTPELKEIASPPTLVPVLMYEQNGTSLSKEQGGPFRIAVLDPAGSPVITEGSGWVKWVDRIEIR
ncbi:MAG: molybdopterin-dependent oxidoreductase [Methanospirillum sp.]|nr:molybdopterin-dependent oxidoreductase [Methanospirillum sp.]